jgi:hypothetical protein
MLIRKWEGASVSSHFCVWYRIYHAGLLVGLPPNRAFASRSRRISASIASMISFVSIARIILSALQEPKAYSYSQHLSAMRVIWGTCASRA